MLPGSSRTITKMMIETATSVAKRATSRPATKRNMGSGSVNGEPETCPAHRSEFAR